MSRADARRAAEQLKISNAEVIVTPPKKSEIQPILQRLRDQAFNDLNAEIEKLPDEQQTLFRKIQLLLPEKEQQ